MAEGEVGALLIQSDNEGAIESSYRIVAGMLRELQREEARTQIRGVRPCLQSCKQGDKTGASLLSLC